MSTAAARRLRIADYTYELPEERIARYPLADRSSAKLLQYKDGEISKHIFRDLPDLLPRGTLLVGNQTRVIHARLQFTLETGKPLEIFCLEPLQPTDYAQSLSSTEPVVWKCLVGGNRRWKSGLLRKTFPHGGREVTLIVERRTHDAESFAITFGWEYDTPLSFGEVLEAVGTVPLPPYLDRPAEADDRQRYQTVFARQEGSVAAPTAGLHFTPEVLQALEARGIEFAPITLHVGAGTFKPVTTETLGDHVMHREYYSATDPFIRRVYQQLLSGKPIVCIGTTSLRCLETLFYEGASIGQGDPWVAEEDQWVATRKQFQRAFNLSAFTTLMDYLDATGEPGISGYTRLLLTPESELRVADGLITNFHQPQSTLLLLVAAILGDDWRRVYDYALANDFRFLSYGDSSLLWRWGART
ncbi:S-adenosylmethionine:tRNA ribosyltransferase-isomerase [Neolewinella sp.]|uniref:S-adenosylmethionine:tRNA ribosyltransferase-isomerase n=1 Tax=Neolewinella sp. TaxID=2993543 RepID=UPI003B52FE27